MARRRARDADDHRTRRHRLEGEALLSELAIVIVSYNARADLERCLASIYAAPPSTPFEVIVVDNASTDGSAEAARRWPQARVIDSGANRGFSAGNNIGIRASSGELVLLLNSDAVVPPGAIDGMVRALRAHPEVAVVGPRLVDGAGQPELSFGPMVSPLAEFRQKRLIHGAARRDSGIMREVEALTRQERRPDWVSGACLLVRRADAEAVGLLDERYFMYLEDVDFCAAIRARGRHVLFAADVEVVHLRGRSAASAPAATNVAYRRSQLAFYRKHHPLFVPLLRAYWLARGIRV